MPSSALFSMGTSSLLGYYPVAKPSLPAFCSLLCKRRFVSDDSAARNGRTASVSAIECRVVQPAGGESVGVAPHRRCTVRNGAGLRPALKVKVWAAQPAPRASVRCPLPPSVVWIAWARVGSRGAPHRTRVEIRSGWDSASIGHLVCLVQTCVKGPLVCYVMLPPSRRRTPTPAAAGEKRTGFRPRENATLLESSEGHDTKRLGRQRAAQRQSRPVDEATGLQ